MILKRLSKIKTKSSFEKVLNRHYDGSAEKFFAELNKESDRLIRTDLKRSQQLIEKTAVLDDFLPENEQANLYRIRARHYHISSDYPKAQKLYLKALSLFEKLRDNVSRARVQKALLDVLMYLGKHDQAADVGRQSLRYFRRNNFHANLGTC